MYIYIGPHALMDHHHVHIYRSTCIDGSPPCTYIYRSTYVDIYIYRSTYIDGITTVYIYIGPHTLMDHHHVHIYIYRSTYMMDHHHVHIYRSTYVDASPPCTHIYIGPHTLMDHHHVHIYRSTYIDGSPPCTHIYI